MQRSTNPRNLDCAAYATAALMALAPLQASATPPATKWPDLQQTSERQGGGEKDAAVIVGIEDYVFAPDVPGAQSNAEAWYRHLTSVRGVPATRVRLLRNEEATVEELRASATAAASEVQPGGTLWFVFIGHGAPASTGDDGLLIGADAQQTATGLESRSLRRSELLQVLESGPGEPVVVLDACFSGQSARGEAIAQGLQPLRLATLATPTSAVVLTAAQSNQYAGTLPGAEVPAFSYLMLGALRGWADDDADGQVTADEAVAYTRAVMRTTIKGRSQTPDAQGPTHKVLGQSNEAGPDLAALVLAAAASPGAAGTLSDTGVGSSTPSPARDADGDQCVDDHGCPEGTSCQGGVCRVDHLYIREMDRKAKSMITGGAIAVGVGAAMVLSIVGVVAAAGDGGVDIDDDAAPVLPAIGVMGVLGVAAGAISLGVGRSRRKRAASLRGGSVAFTPTFVRDGRSIAIGLRGRF